MEIYFEVDGKRVSSNDVGPAINRAILDAVSDELHSLLSSIQDPDTGEFPTVVVRGTSLDKLSVQIEGSDAVIALADQRLARKFGTASLERTRATRSDPPYVFLCHGSEDKQLVERLARDLRAHGIDVFFDKWCIEPGQSIRQRIEGGLTECTHFVVLLTQSSIRKAWVNAEIDAGFFRKIDGLCRFVPLRHQLEVSALPPLLRSLNSPTLNDYEADVRSLVGYFHGVSDAPPVADRPMFAERREKDMGVSAAAARLIDMLMQGTEHGLAMDPQLAAGELQREAGLTDDEIIDAVFELEGRGVINKHVDSSSGSLGFARIVPEAALFVEFDAYYEDWVPADDAARVAAELMHDESDSLSLQSLSERLGWAARRLNPAVSFLIERRLVRESNAIGLGCWCTAWIRQTDATGRFLRHRN